MRIPHRIFAALLVIGTAGPLPAAAETPHQAWGESSRSSPAPAQFWRARAFPNSAVARMRYAAVPAERWQRLRRANAVPGVKAIQIGIGRRAALESTRAFLPPLKWTPVAGGMASRIEIASDGAMALRVGLYVLRLDERIELRFGGSGEAGRVVAAMTGAEIERLHGPDGLFWTPSTDGEAQIIEIFRPFGVPASAVMLEAPMVSHLLVDHRHVKDAQRIGESEPCNVDVVCRVGELGPAFVNVKNAVAHMQFVRAGGGSFMCTGTLLNDTVPVTQIPYFHSANHCFASNDTLPPVPSEMQAVANTLNTFWNYEATTCNGESSERATILSGGATYLFSSHASDAMLLRLNNAAPAGAFFAGWSAAPMTADVAVTAVHHPSGDAKKVSLGTSVALDGSETVVGWLSGTTESGSSGSGLFTLGPGGQYVLRGGLIGGNAACANSGSLSNADNRDFYSRLDMDFPILKSFLEPQPEAREDTAPKLRPRPASAAPTSDLPTSTAPAGGRTLPRDDNSGRRNDRT